jgi:hypothetical protein
MVLLRLAIDFGQVRNVPLNTLLLGRDSVNKAKTMPKRSPDLDILRSQGSLAKPLTVFRDGVARMPGRK